jgi:gliding motility-associated-like protein
MLTRSGCNGDSVSTETDTLSTIYLNSSLGVNNNDTLTWNEPITPLLPTHIQKYYIYKQYPIGSSWILLDSTNVTNFVDTTNSNLCAADIAYKVTMFDSSGCSLISSIDTVSWDNNFSADIYPTDTMICDGDSVTISTDPGYTYLWNTGQVSQSIVVYTSNLYSVILTDSSSCKDTLYSTIVVNQLPNPPTILGNLVFCQGDSTTISTSIAYSNYQWSNGSSSPTINVNNQSTITLTITDSNGCKSLDSVTTIVNQLPIFTINGTNELCYPDSSLLSSSNVYSSYLWNTSQSTQSIYVSTTGTYTLSVIDSNGCKSTNTFNFISRPVPIVSFTNDTSISCSKTTIQFTNTSVSEPGSTFFWNLGNGETSTLENPNIQYVDTGYYNVQLVVTSPYGCKDSVTNQVYAIFYPLPIADFITDQNITNIVDQRIYFTDQSQNAVSWYWSFGDGNYSTNQNPYHDYVEEGEYNVKLVIKNISGCEDSITKKVMIIQIFTPNSFTPNQDGINDYFYTHSEGIPNFQYLRVWDRWGILMFETNPMSKVWDGYDLNGKPAPAGIYIYDIKYVTRTGQEFFVKGQLTLTR